jgi:acetoin utilization deacetylase AcuC-like enzyme
LNHNISEGFILSVPGGLMDSLVFYFPEGHQKHHIYGHPERPERIQAIREGLEEAGFWDSFPVVSPLSPSREVLEAVHDRDYLSLLERTSRQEQMLDPDTYATRDSWELAQNAAGGALAVIDQVWEGNARTGFALTRPPGHHATRFRAMGFCLINNVAVAAEYLLMEKGSKRVAILDLDLHHGNGTQDIFWERGDVYYISIHQAPFYPGTGALQEFGAGPGEGATLNLPVPAYTGDKGSQRLLSEIILPYLAEANPDMLLISYGFDTHWLDPLGSMQVSGDGIYQMILKLKGWADTHCQGKIAVILEGGYSLDAGKVCGQAVAAGLLMDDWHDPLGQSPDSEGDAWQSILQEARIMLGY